jgi:putative membrane protein
MAATLATTLQMGFLGALLAFAPAPLFAVHAFTTAPWGLTTLEDQQLGGVIMWIPAGGIFLAAIVAATAIAMQGGEMPRVSTHVLSKPQATAGR